MFLVNILSSSMVKKHGHKNSDVGPSFDLNGLKHNEVRGLLDSEQDGHKLSADAFCGNAI